MAARYMDMANALYTLMLRILVQVYTVEQRNSGSKRVMLDTSIALMHAMASVGETLTYLPANDGSDVNAGMSFAMVRSLAPLESSSETRLLVERLGQVNRAFADLGSELERTGGEGHDICVSELQRSRELMERCRERLEATPLAREQAKVVPIVPPAPQAQRAPAEGRERVRGKSLLLSFEAKRCIHSRHCVTELPRVFKANTPGEWLFPDETDPEHLCAVARECPSGAIQYERLDGGPTEPAPEVNLLRVRENGPYALLANLQVAGEPIGYRATLCRCGQSKNKPFCDGQHVEARFTATGEPATLDTSALSARDGVLAVEPTQNGPLSITGNLELCAGTGRVVLRTGAVALCRCGKSNTKPLCDGSHVAAGFKS